MKRFVMDCLIVVVVGLLLTAPIWGQACPCKAGGGVCACPAGVCPDCPASAFKSHYAALPPAVAQTPVAVSLPQYRTVCDRGQCFRVQVGSGTPPPAELNVGRGVPAAVLSSAMPRHAVEPAFPRMVAIAQSRPILRLANAVTHPFYRRGR